MKGKKGEKEAKEKEEKGGGKIITVRGNGEKMGGL